MFADEGRPAGAQFDWSSVPVGVYVGAAIAVGVLLLVLLAVGLVAYRRAKRTGSWRRMSLTVQSEALGPGPRRDLARLRLRLDGAMGAADSAAAAAREAGAVGDLDQLAGQLRSTGERLARQLDVLADGMTDVALGGVMSTLTEQVASIERLANELIGGAARAAAGSSGVELDQLTGAVADELKMVGYRVDALHELSASEATTTPPRTS